MSYTYYTYLDSSISTSDLIAFEPDAQLEPNDQFTIGGLLVKLRGAVEDDFDTLLSKSGVFPKSILSFRYLTTELRGDETLIMFRIIKQLIVSRPNLNLLLISEEFNNVISYEDRQLFVSSDYAQFVAAFVPLVVNWFPGRSR